MEVIPLPLAAPLGLALTNPGPKPYTDRMTDVLLDPMAGLLTRLRGGLIVSCQALPAEPLFGAEIMARMAAAAAEGGAVAIRAGSPADVAAIRAAVALPLIGLWKVNVSGSDVYITPRVSDAVAIAGAGADIIALDATARPRPEGGDAAGFIRLVQRATGRPVLADVSTEDEARAAQNAGAEFISTTLSGYTPYSPQQTAPDLGLIRRLAPVLTAPLIAEGRIVTPQQAREALQAGAFAVVVGGAITRPQQITARFAEALQHDVPRH